MVKRSAAVVIAAIITLSAAGCGSKKDSKPDNGKMRGGMSAMDYAKDMGVGINLGNTMEAYWQDLKNTTSGASKVGDTPQDFEQCWGAVVTTPECIEGMI